MGSERYSPWLGLANRPGTVPGDLFVGVMLAHGDRMNLSGRTSICCRFTLFVVLVRLALVWCFGSGWLLLLVSLLQVVSLVDRWVRVLVRLVSVVLTIVWIVVIVWFLLLAVLSADRYRLCRRNRLYVLSVCSDIFCGLAWCNLFIFTMS